MKLGYHTEKSCYENNNLNKFLIIIDNCDDFISNHLQKFEDCIYNFIKHTQYSQFIICATQRSEFKFNKINDSSYKVVKISQLSYQDAYTLFQEDIKNLSLMQNNPQVLESILTKLDKKPGNVLALSLNIRTNLQQLIQAYLLRESLQPSAREIHQMQE